MNSEPSPLNSPTAEFIAWVKASNTEDRGVIFLMINSLARQRSPNGSFDHDVLDNFRAKFSTTKFILHADKTTDYLSQITPDRFAVEMEALEPLRPPEDIGGMMKDKDHVYRGLIIDDNHFLRVKKAYDSINDNTGKTDVPESHDFPTDKETQRRMIGDLFYAIVNRAPDTLIDGLKRKVQSDAERNQNNQSTYTDSTHMKRVAIAANVEIELAAWQILLATRDAQDGLVQIPPWSAAWKYERYNSFRERFEEVKNACLHSKSVVNGVMAGNLLRRLAAGPKSEYETKRVNKVINHQRDQHNHLGRIAIEENKYACDPDGTLRDLSTGTCVYKPPPPIPYLQQESEKKKQTKGRKPSARQRTAAKAMPSQQENQFGAATFTASPSVFPFSHVLDAVGQPQSFDFNFDLGTSSYPNMQPTINPLSAGVPTTPSRYNPLTGIGFDNMNAQSHLFGATNLPDLSSLTGDSSLLMQPVPGIGQGAALYNPVDTATSNLSTSALADIDFSNLLNDPEVDLDKSIEEFARELGLAPNSASTQAAGRDQPASNTFVAPSIPGDDMSQLNEVIEAAKMLPSGDNIDGLLEETIKRSGEA